VVIFLCVITSNETIIPNEVKSWWNMVSCVVIKLVIVILDITMRINGDGMIS